MFPVIPVISVIDTYGPVNPSYESTTFLQLATLLCASFTVHRVTLKVLPEFRPNEYLEKTHVGLGPEPWKIYANAV